MRSLSENNRLGVLHIFYLCWFSIFLTLSCKNESPHPLPERTEDFCATIHRNEEISLNEEVQSIKDSLGTKSGVYVLEDGGGALVTRAWLSEYAEKSIDIQYFIFSTDNVGLIACDYLVRAADRGVKVRIIVDDIMVDARLEDIINFDAHKNIEVKIYNPGSNLGKNLYQKLKKLATDFRSFNQRMHNKTFIVDDQYVITGGRNIADEYFDYNHDYNFRDRDVFLMGKVSRDVKNSFEDFWESELSVPVSELSNKKYNWSPDSIRFERLHQYACNEDNFWPQIRARIDSFDRTIERIKKSKDLNWLDQVDFISDDPGKNSGDKGLGGGGKCTDALIQLVHNAKESIVIQSPYLITTDVGMSLFQSAISKGVEIKIQTNSLASTDNVEAFSSYQKVRNELLEMGVRIFEFKPDAAIRKQIMTGDLQETIDFIPIFGHHAKSMVIDEKITVIGTFNLDPRSANLNTECVVVLHSPELSQSVLRGMEAEMEPQNSWETTLDFNPDREVKRSKRLKTWTRKILPKSIL